MPTPSAVLFLLHNGLGIARWSLARLLGNKKLQSWVSSAPRLISISYAFLVHFSRCVFLLRSSVTLTLVTSLDAISNCRNMNIRHRYRSTLSRPLCVNVTSWHVHKQVMRPLIFTNLWQASRWIHQCYFPVIVGYFHYFQLAFQST